MPPFCVSHENYSDLPVGSVQFNRITAGVCLKTGSAAEGAKRAEDALRAAPAARLRNARNGKMRPSQLGRIFPLQIKHSSVKTKEKLIYY